MSGLHDDHRKRLRERYVKDGAGSLTEERLLELLLFTPIPRKDTYDISKRLLRRFGNLRGVLEANFYDLQEVEDVGYSTALYLKAIHDAAVNYILPHTPPPKRFSSDKALEKFLLEQFEDSVVEKVIVICFNRDSQVVHFGVLQQGDVSAASFHMKRLTELAIRTNAARIVLAHNHPSGSKMPSDEDISATNQITRSLASNGIELTEHYIIYSREGITPIIKTVGRATEEYY